MTDQLCAQIAALPQLLDLSLTGNWRLSQQALGTIAHMPRLSALDLSDCPMTDALFEHLAQHCHSLTALKMCNMHSASVTPAAVAHLSRLPRLRWSLVDAGGFHSSVTRAVKARRHWTVTV
jgi:hypothetical protein